MLDAIPLEDEERAGLRALLVGNDLAASAARAETWFAPFRVTGAGIPTFVVPIKTTWASELFDSALASGQLFLRTWQLGLRRELVYYRSPLNSGGLRAPARILWYVSGRPNEPGARAIRAVSSLTEVLVAQPTHLWHRFQRLGVYREQDISKSAKHGEAMALKFANTELLERPVSLDDYREAMTGDPKSKSAPLPSPQLISERVFVELLGRGTHNGR